MSLKAAPDTLGTAPSPLELRFMDRAKASLVAEQMLDDGAGDLLSRTLRLRDGTPLFMRDLRPAEFWFHFGLHLARVQRGSTLRDYSHIAATFARFLDGRLMLPDDVTEADIVEYRIRRKEVDGISSSSWDKEATVVQSIFDYAIHVGRRTGYPWFRQGRRSALRQPSRSAPDTRGLSEAEWLQFKQLGLLGRDMAGMENPRFRTVWVMRNVVGAELALSTGLRVQEFSTLLLPEVITPRSEAGGVELTIQATAKGGRQRRIQIPSGVASQVRAYVKTDRAALVAHLRGRSRSVPRARFIIKDWQPGDRFLSGQIDGEQRTFEIKRMPMDLRAATFVQTDLGVEPLAVFVNSWGRMTSKATWHRVFNVASAHVASYQDTFPAARDVHPHTLRHTFARRYLAFLRKASRSSPYLEEWGETDEVVVVQRTLGHANIATTSLYVSGDPVSGVVEELFYQATNTDEDFAELIERYLLEQSRARYA